MKLHREGLKIVNITWMITAIIVMVINLVFPVHTWFHFVAYILIVKVLITVTFFFRVPKRNMNIAENIALSSCDGRVVAVEEVFDNEFFNDKRIQVSVFMSVYNVHINWFPFSGKVKYVKYHHGKYLVANHPKSSLENERTSVVIENTKGHNVMIRQIAGAVAKRIVCYAREGEDVQQCEELGFIKFGSRVDFLLPLDADIKVKIGQKVRGGIDVIAGFKN